MTDHDLDETRVFEVIGEEGFARLTRAFYSSVAQDDLLRPMYPQDDLAGAEQRLRDFLVFRFGGPTRYLDQRGHPRLRMRHAPFSIDQQARDRWMHLMEQALEEAALPAECIAILRPFFDSAATFMINNN